MRNQRVSPALITASHISKINIHEIEFSDPGVRSLHPVKVPPLERRVSALNRPPVETFLIRRRRTKVQFPAPVAIINIPIDTPLFAAG